MTEPIKQDLRKLLLPYGQEHLVAHWDHLDRGDQEQLAAQIRDLDLEETRLLFEQATHATPECIDWTQVRPAPVHQLPVEETDEAEAIQQGNETLLGSNMDGAKHVTYSTIRKTQFSLL